MSAKNRKKRSRPKEDYFTPAWTVHRLLERVALPAGRWLEPMAGEGDIIKAVTDKYGAYADFSAVELQSKYIPALRQSGANAIHHGNLFRLMKHYPWRKSHMRMDVVIGNPAFSLAERLIKALFELEPDYIVMLLRLNWLGSEEREGFLSEYMPDVYVLPNRPGFEEEFGKTDATEYAWMIWRPRIRKELEAAGVPGLMGTIQLLDSTGLEERKDDHRAIFQRRKRARRQVRFGLKRYGERDAQHLGG